jgi:hypothetical protein
MNPQGPYPPLTKAFLPINGDFVHIPTASDLQPDAEIMAVQNGELHHSGRVTDVMPSMGVCWIFDELCGARKLIEWDEFRIFGRPNAVAGTHHNAKEEQ